VAGPSTDDLYAASRRGPFVIAGPCVLESRSLALEVSSRLLEVSRALGVTLVFKSSFDKANRTSGANFRGPGLEEGLDILAEVKAATGLPVITDIHLPDQAARVARVVDVLQIPAFLSRQTDLLLAAGETGRIVNIKKGQFLAPWDVKPAADKVASTGNSRIWLTERGASFGYNNLVVDMRSLKIMAGLGYPVVFDATHSVQLPGGQGTSSGGQREFVPVLARAAVAAGCDGVFMEVHPRPAEAFCDGPNSWPLDRFQDILGDLKKLWDIDYAC
jgi:2-dehydro-3-deoxyphosphooctonate aldolase (KDO 8-P synthase)